MEIQFYLGEPMDWLWSPRALLNKSRMMVEKAQNFLVHSMHNIARMNSIFVSIITFFEGASQIGRDIPTARHLVHVVMLQAGNFSFR